MNKKKTKIEEEEQKTGRRKMLYKGYKSTYDFAKFRTISAFGNVVKNGTITIHTTNNEPKKKEEKEKKGS